MRDELPGELMRKLMYCPCCQHQGWIVPEFVKDNRPFGFKCIQCGAGTVTRREAAKEKQT